MSDMKEAAIQIRVNADGKVTLSIDETLRRSVITACSQAFCGAFDFAGEHENEVVKKHWPRSLVMKAIRTKKLKVNGKKEDASFRLSRGDDVVSYVLEEKKNTEPVILYEDENLLAAVKPAGLLSLDPEGKEKDTLLTRVNKYLEGKGEAPAIPVHRIDFHTEGILLFAKNRPAADALEDSHHRIRKNGSHRRPYPREMPSHHSKNPPDPHPARPHRPPDLRRRQIRIQSAEQRI